MDRAYLRFVAWIGTASAIAALAAPNFLPLLGQAVNDAFGTVFPAIPFAGLLALLFLFRWGDLRKLLMREEGLVSNPLTRLLGLGIIVSLLALRGVTSQLVELSGVAVVFVFYGTALVLNPLTWRMTLPYAAICAVGVAAPGILQWSLGEPLAWLSSVFSAGIVSLSGVPVVWQGTQFALQSKTGELVTATITPGCSSIISVTTFLGLLGLMHIDMGKDVFSTVKLAVAGVVALTALNSARIAILIFVGYEGGADALWSVHNWVGYALFLGFYVATLLIYPRMGGRVKSATLSLSGASPANIG
ncbi:MAG: exosortase/archaeosortase family protein [Nitrososphaerales archaeon]|nr:exosortase/archaeosortase family protein [Nitrososphaerales archaeon]